MPKNGPLLADTALGEIEAQERAGILGLPRTPELTTVQTLIDATVTPSDSD